MNKTEPILTRFQKICDKWDKYIKESNKPMTHKIYGEQQAILDNHVSLRCGAKTMKSLSKSWL